jgi:hypothetical protein
MKSRRWFLGFLWGSVLAIVCGGATMAAEPMITVAVSSADDLLGRFRILAKLGGEEAAQAALAPLDQLEQRGTMAWLDRTRPIVVCAAFDPATGTAGFQLFLPTTRRDDLLAAVKQMGLAVDDQPGVEGFSHRVELPQGAVGPLYVLANPPEGYAVATNTPEDAAALRAVKPAELKPARPGTLLTTFRLDRLPAATRDGFLANFKERNAAQHQRREGESDAAYNVRMVALTFVESQIEALVRDGRELTLDADVDDARGRMTLTLGLDARPDSPLAATIQSYSRLKSRFHQVGASTAMTIRGVLPLPESFRALLRDQLDQGLAHARETMPEDDARMISQLVEAARPTLTAEVIDGCLVMDALPPIAEGKKRTAAMLFGMAAQQPEKFEAALREGVQRAKEEDRARFAFNIDRSALGTPIHRFEGPDNNFSADLFGEPQLFFALPSQGSFLGLGTNGLTLVKDALKAFEGPARAPADAPQLELALELQRFAALPLEGNDQEVNAAAAREAFQGPTATRDRVQLGLSSTPRQVKLQLDADLPVLRFFYLVGQHRKE